MFRRLTHTFACKRLRPGRQMSSVVTFPGSTPTVMATIADGKDLEIS